ncbi:hypothetical protein BCR36DRAFT_406122 [Piromyces finnis]|uniref:Uncharacterized protein n=1 Tax=Piromyces finnis TaxID=1754191 RepID=A0A1Y1V1K2_9FUNG|nr:hypothetical protein BCR36DRAFT_406122 [Piromyces finnis]|eukprot:ORX45232.1 hypothetical protein BCR36DRAFT_406122 [Piromyces finnis]
MGCGASKNVNPDNTNNTNKPQDNQTTAKKEILESKVKKAPKEKINTNTNKNVDTKNSNQIINKNLCKPKIEIKNSDSTTIIQTEFEPATIVNNTTESSKKSMIEKNPRLPTSSNEKIVENLSSPQEKSEIPPSKNELAVPPTMKNFEKSSSSIQIDNNVDFTVIKMEKNDDTNSKASSKKKEKKQNKNKNKINDDLEIQNVDEEQLEGNLLLAQKPLDFKADYYNMNQELTNKNSNNDDNSVDRKTEEDEDDEDDPNEPKVITNSFFTENENPTSKKKNKFFRSNSKAKKKNDIVVIKSNSLVNSQHNSTNSLDCDINEMSKHGKPNRNNNSMNNNDENISTHPFSVI